MGVRSSPGQVTFRLRTPQCACVLCKVPVGKRVNTPLHNGDLGEESEQGEGCGGTEGRGCSVCVGGGGGRGGRVRKEGGREGQKVGERPGREVGVRK